MNLEERIFSVNNFLEEDRANYFHGMISIIPKHWFSISIKPCDLDYSLKRFPEDNQLMDSEEFKNGIDFCMNAYENNNFAYCFKRTYANHYDNCTCSVCELDKYFRSEEILNRLSEIVGERVIKLNETFVSKYEKGNFLTTHHDKGNGDFAFIYQMTKDWNPNHGGMLHFVEGNKVMRVVSPEFNTLTIFRIKDVPITDHFVSMVTAENKTRMAFTGWFTIE